MSRPILLPLMAIVLGLAAACGSASVEKLPPLPGGGFPDAGGSGGGCDADADGAPGPACRGPDCDDADASVHPGATEACDGKDSDCDGLTDEGCGCVPGDMERCFEGEAAKRGVGRCADGWQICKADRAWGPCTGSVLPADEGPGCDGVDSNCDGQADAGCGGCPPGAEEVCGNGLDDDCDGTIDPPEICVFSCRDVNPRAGEAGAGALACCLRVPPALHELRCHEGGGLAPCGDRACEDLDGSPDTSCVKQCDAKGCLCGRRLPSSEIVEVSDCGFLSPCARLNCDERAGQPCYGGPPGTLGVGICRGGVHSCADAGQGDLAWDACEGQQPPLPAEICGNGLDDDCDGFIDEAEGSTASCRTRSCPPGAIERCRNGLDDDCDGFVDETCTAEAGAKQACWSGSLDARNVGLCKDGQQIESSGFWGPCTGEVLPAREVCGDRKDSDCNGLGGPDGPEEPGCCVPREETCNGVDDDCDGLADEGLVNRCGQCEGTGSCFGASIRDVGDCSVDGRVCEGVEASPFDPTLITLTGDAAGGGSQRLYGIQLVGGVTSLVQVDVASGEILWAKDYSEGTPSAVVAAGDGGAWLHFASTILHVSADGEIVCKTETAGTESCPDPEGDIWVNLGGTIRRWSATDPILEQSPGVPWPDGIPRCAIVDLDPGNASTTDLAVTVANVCVHDGQRVWSFGSGLGVTYVNVAELAVHVVEPSTVGAWFAYPVLAADGKLWGGSPLRWLDPEEAKDVSGAAPYHQPGNFSTGYVAGLSDGSGVGLLTAPSKIVHVDSGTGAEIDTFAAPAEITSQIAVDGSDRVWATTAAKLVSLDVGSGKWSETPIENGTIGIGRFAVTRTIAGGGGSEGRWAQVLDPGAFDVRWGELTWDAHFAGKTRVQARVRFADSRDALETSKFVCGPFDAPPADLSRCSGRRRYALIELLLSGSGRPVAGNVGVTWDRP